MFFTFKKNSHLEKYYKELNDVCTLDKEGTRCATTIDISSSTPHVKTLYEKLNGNYNKFSYVDGKFNQFKEEPLKRCIYLKYWFYDQVIKNGFNSNTVQEIFNLCNQNNYEMNFLIYKWDENNRGSYEPHDFVECQFKINTFEDIKKIKSFFDYIENYEGSQKKSTINDLMCTSTYKNDLNEIIIKYNNTNTCADSISDAYCNELKNLKEIHKFNELSELKCNEKPTADALSGEQRVVGELSPRGSGDQRLTNLQENMSQLEDNSILDGHHYITYNPT
ncbi:PIR Superfamily Protein [Plasmodium ovale wallikeri]|uniref:PIR Superfamily Protein n=1 Tax=Plasmodium ovale wallikeri TaxID=864142 RepID=A0A1A9AN13_PLAOA|nr:PIR Superfamily Protein [Plasmodium ovale wallikeri]SBT57594.1 PIR Superfamily Protein [Plasmodium ovale wallikeri]